MSAEGSMGKGKPREFAESKRKAEKPFSSRDEESDADVTRRSLSETLVADEQLEDTGKTETTLEHQQRRKKRPTIESSPAPASPTPEVELELDKAPEQTNGAKSNEDMKDESDLSSLEDDSPPPKAKQRRKKGDTEADKPNKSKPTKPEPKSKPESTPQEAEIKKLQGQLVKCGVRKVWGSYLKKYETPKQKIAHLRNMLEDVGMTGRFSEDRARQIKEERELKADIDAITEGEKKWGKAPEEPGRKRLAKGLQELEGLVDDDAESD